MTLRDLYKDIDDNYNRAIGYLMDEERVSKFICFFPNDINFRIINEAWKTKDGERIYLASYTLRSLASTLGLNNITKTLKNISDYFRPNSIFGVSNIDIDDQMNHLIIEHKMINDAISNYMINQ